MKRLTAVLLALLLLLTFAAALASEETLYGRTIALLEDGDASIPYDGLGLSVTMDGSDYPAGLVTANLNAATGLIRIENGENYALWEQITPTDLVTTLMVLCGRWSKLAEDMPDSFQIIFTIAEDTEDGTLTLTTAEDAYAFLSYIAQQKDQQ